MKYLFILAICLTSFKFPTKMELFLLKYAPIAQAIQNETGIPASIQLAQAYIESGGGKSYIAINSRNHFGIRAFKGAWEGQVFYDRKNSAWRCYDTELDGWKDHAQFLCEHYSSGIGQNYKYWAGFEGYGGKDYWKVVVRFIEKHRLNDFDY